MKIKKSIIKQQNRKNPINQSQLKFNNKNKSMKNNQNPMKN